MWHILEGHFSLTLANAMHVRNVPGRKSDKNDATWLADLARRRLDSTYLRAEAIELVPAVETGITVRLRFSGAPKYRFSSVEVRFALP